MCLKTLNNVEKLKKNKTKKNIKTFKTAENLKKYKLKKHQKL